MTIIEIVDKNDKIIKKIEEKDKLKSDITRSAAVMIFDSKGNILLQLRSKTDSKFPICWDISGAGHVDLGESYEAAAHRELFEEIGVKTDIVFIAKYLFEVGDGRRYFNTLYRGEYEGEFKLDPNEVDDVKFFSKEELRKMIKDESKFHPECLYVLKKYFL